MGNVRLNSDPIVVVLKVYTYIFQDMSFYDVDVDDLEDDDQFVGDNHDWKDSAVLKIHDCARQDD
jgi:hypothetical protein